MSNRRMEFFIGMMVIGIIAGVFVMTILFGSERGFFVGNKGGQRMTIVFEKGGGISQNSLVLKNGIKIGRVYSVELKDMIERSEVHVSFELEPGNKIYSNEYAKINRTILGDASIEFVDDPEYLGEVFEISAEDVIPGRNTGDIMGTVSNIEGDLAKALENINNASAGVAEFMGRLNQFMGDEIDVTEKSDRLKGVFDDLAGTLQSIKSLADNLDIVVSDEEIVDNIRKATGEAPKLLEQVGNLTQGAQGFMDNAQELGEQVRSTLARAQTTFDLVDKNLDNVTVFTTALAEDGPALTSALNESAGEIRSTITNVRDAVVNISSLAEALNEKLDDPDSPLGVLADEETAASLRHIIKNAEEISQKLYPIMDDARVFTNKIAHRPSSLVWDRTTSKGVNLKSKFGCQSLSPSGGVSSPLYRQTAAGAKIRERNYYEPAADEEYMDDSTRAAYQNAVADLDAARAQNNGWGASRSALLPAVSENAGGGFFSSLHKSCKERTARVRWSLASLWNSCTGAGDAVDQEYVGECGEYYGEPVQAQQLLPYAASFVGYDQYADDGMNVGQPVYNGYGANYGEIQDYEQYDASPYNPAQSNENPFYGQCQTSECGVPQCQTSECGVPQCQTSECGVPECGPTSCEPGCQGSLTTGNGYAPNRSKGGYTRPNNNLDSNEPGRLGPYRAPGEAVPPRNSYDPAETAPTLDDADAYEIPEEIEELPPSINRIARPTTDDSFEDDGLPVDFAPPTF